VSFGRDLRATLPSLLVVPIGLAIVKAAVDRIPVDTTPPEPLIPPRKNEGLVPDVPIFPVKPRVVVPLPPPGPTKFRVDIPEGVVPFFPKQTGTPKGVNIDPSKFPKIGNISELNFQTGLFDPAVQARLRARQ